MDESIHKHLAKNDDVLKGISKVITLSSIENTQQVFHDLMSCIIEQQIHYRSTKKVFQKMMDAADLKILSVENFSVFEEKGFTNTKLTIKKQETILRIVDFFEQNKVDWKKLDETEIRKILSQIKGIGTWTIDMILLYTLEKPNIFPADDYHLRLMMTKLYNIDTSARVKAQQKAIAENWAPYKSYGVRYLLDWKNFQKKADYETIGLGRFGIDERFDPKMVV